MFESATCLFYKNVEDLELKKETEYIINVNVYIFFYKFQIPISCTYKYTNSEMKQYWVFLHVNNS